MVKERPKAEVSSGVFFQPMLIPFLQVQAIFPDQRLLVQSLAPGDMVWDRHHGAIYVLRVGSLKSGPAPEDATEAGIRCALSLAPADSLRQEMENFAGDMKLPLNLLPDPLPALVEKLTLAACHVPEAKLFVFSEAAELTARRSAADAVELEIAGPFRSARAPCQETDLVLHLEQPAAARLLSYLFSLAREKR